MEQREEAMRRKQDSVSYHIEFDLLIEANEEISQEVFKSIKDIVAGLIMNDTTHYDTNEEPHFLFPRHLKISKHEITKTSRLFP